MLRTMIALLALFAAPTLAQEAEYRSGEGDLYVLTTTRSGVILTSRAPVVRSVGGASLGGPDVLTLRADCTAEADGQVGSWGQGLLGFEAALPGRSVTFPVQRLAVDGAGCPRP